MTEIELLERGFQLHLSPYHPAFICCPKHMRPMRTVQTQSCSSGNTS